MMVQTPPPGGWLLRWAGDTLEVELAVDPPRKGRAALRTNIGRAAVRRRETVLATERGETPMAAAWHDIPMRETAPGRFAVSVPLAEPGTFSAKACFFPEGAESPEWPEGENFHVKTAPARTARANSIYTVFTRQFGPSIERDARTPEIGNAEAVLDAAGYAAIPPSGTFREVARRLDHIMDRLGFRIVQLLPVHPVPTTFARMGRFGSAFAAMDFLSVDPAYAEFDARATPMDQFRELADAVHRRGGLLFIDLPANHTGWAATLQEHRPEWYRRRDGGAFASPGAWGVVWEDLVELDYSFPGLRAYMADVFLHWCRNGVDGFRCDAGYMIPAETWEYITARVRDEYPDTVFMLEGLGGKVETTEELISRCGLDWAYSELFQTYDRPAFEWYLPRAIEMSEKCGPLVHFAETHDNDRLAAKGRTYARMRTALSALLSHQGAWGMANGVEWYADAKIDVHGASPLRWGAEDNMCGLVARLNRLLASHPAFGPHTRLEMVQAGGGNFVAVARHAPGGGAPLLVAANLDCENPATARWREDAFPAGTAYDLLGGRKIACAAGGGVELAPGQVVCLSRTPYDPPEPAPFPPAEDVPAGAAEWAYPADLRRDVPVPYGAALAVRSAHPFRAELKDGARTLCAAVSGTARGGGYSAVLSLPEAAARGLAASPRRMELSLKASFFKEDGAERAVSPVSFLPPGENVKVPFAADRAALLADRTLEAVLSNGAGASAKIPAAWGEVFSKYDSLFSANPDPAVPSDRLVLWTRCRAWLRHEGYSRELNRDCMSGFRVSPQGRFAEWRFAVPCGMGEETDFAFRLSIEKEANAVRLRVTRGTGGKPSGKVRLVFRPDVDWRSFHACTKAYAGPEKVFPAGTRPAGRGFSFSPYGCGAFELRADRGEFHEAPEWSYCVPHPEDAGRGQDPAGDMFSPGWFAFDFAPGDSFTLRGALDGASGEDVSGGGAPDSAGIGEAAAAAMDLFMARRDELRTVIAGYPWFLDWGRDTLIFLRGTIAAGRLAESLDILREFARFEDRGTIPNIIHGSDTRNRDTSDAPLWLVAAAADLCAAAPRGARRALASDCGGRTLLDVLESVADSYIAGTPNGIRMDPGTGLVYSPPHFTWMDTNYPACTPRAGYPVEIQALWIHALRFLAERGRTAAGRESRAALAAKAQESLETLFRVPGCGLADCLRAAPGQGAHTAEKEDAVRPNQLFAVALGDVVPAGSELAREICGASARLLVPGAIRSVADRATACDFSVRSAAGAPLNDPHNPYKGRYEGDEDSSRKPAYHNGTAWTWCFPAYAEAMAANGGTEEARRAALSLLGSSAALFESGCLGHLPEIADGDAPHAQRGCCAQAWGVSELYRVWKKLSRAGDGAEREKSRRRRQ